MQKTFVTFIGILLVEFLIAQNVGVGTINHLIEAVKEQQKEIELLKTEVRKLKRN